MTNQNGPTTEITITNEHLQELFRRLPAANEVMRMILLETENVALKARVEALENPPETITAASSEVVTSNN
tara:strand:- start:2467 stop:2679 length:213 start_codon:yes stop_codon:yes gene_type:complete